MTQTVEDVSEAQESKVCAQPNVKERLKVLQYEYIRTWNIK